MCYFAVTLTNLRVNLGLGSKFCLCFKNSIIGYGKKEGWFLVFLSAKMMVGERKHRVIGVCRSV